MSHGLPGRLIVLEGIDGAGTTTHARRLVETLRREGHAVELTWEPTKGPIGALLRRALEGRALDPEASEPTARAFDWATMALLFAADRRDHVETRLLPALREGRVVVSDRFVLSSLVYQSATSPQGEAALPWLRALNQEAPRPDLTLVLDVTLATSEARRHARGASPELFERRELQARLAALYAEAERLVPEDRVVHVDSEGPVEAVAEQVYAAVATLLAG